MAKTEDFNRQKCQQLEQIVSQGNGLLVPEDARENFRSTVRMDVNYFATTGDFHIVRYDDPEEGLSLKLAVFKNDRISKSYAINDDVVCECMPGRSGKTVSYEICGTEFEVPRSIVDETRGLIERAKEDPYHGHVFGEIERIAKGKLGEKLQEAYEAFANQIYAGKEPETDALMQLIVLAKWKAMDIRDATAPGTSAYDTFEHIILCEQELS